MKCIHDVVLLLDNFFLVAFAPRVTPLVQSELLESFPNLLCIHGHVTGAHDDLSQCDQVQPDSCIAGQVHGRFNHVELIILKALINVFHAHLKQCKLRAVVESSDGGHPHVVIGIGIKRLKKFD